ncbi:glycosyltransferase family 2 protein [Cellulomonas aerilata]|uniref:Glycosyl transferase n=1 Tax=Cellulomonas aerilata TaxID=515326 RepID=A0A512DDB5_9CELL|nr:glycosyltransferase family 2 protein [Cellulomonas aerilata]GEO34453.1 glycosyl transferase [Cellulomonas aerilata]
MPPEPTPGPDDAPGRDGGPRLDALSVVVPVHDEEAWVGACLEALLAAGDAAGLPLDVVVVDDGSTDGTAAVLAGLAASHPGIRVHTQANAGRFAARTAGITLARGPWVLLLDSRVVVGDGSLRWVREQLAEHPDRQVWCGHVEVETGNAYAAFWSGLVKIGWRRYTARPRLVSFGAEEFDLYPKGTGCLLVRRDLLLSAVGAFESLYDRAHLASDDTRLLRDIAGRTRIWLSPDFAFRYHGKSGGRAFVRQSFFRGTTFVDGYLGQPGVVRRALLAAVGLGLAGCVVAVRRPAVAAAGAAAVAVAVPTAVRLVGGSTAEVRAAAALTPVFVPVFGAGVLRGLALAARARLAQRGTARG